MNNWQRNLYASWAAQMLALVGFSATIPFLPLFLQDLGIKDPATNILLTGLMTTVSFVAMAVMAPIWGILSDMYGRKSMVFRAMFAGFIIVGMMGLTDQVWQLVVLRILQGAFTGSISASTAFVASIVPQDKMGFALGLMQTAVYAGISIGPLLGGVVGDSLGHRYIFVITAVMLLIASAVVWFLIHEDFVRPPRAKKGSFGRTIFGDISSVSRLPGLMAMATVLAVLQLSNVLISPILTIFVQQLGSIGLGIGISTSVGLIGAGAGLASAVSSVVGGRVSDRYGHYRVLVVLAVGAGLTHLPQAFVTDSFQLFLLRCLSGLFVGGMLPSANAIISQVTPRDKRGTAYGFVNMIASLGLAVGPISGAVLTAVINPQIAFLANALILILLAFWIGFGPPRHVMARLSAPKLEAIPLGQAIAPKDVE